MEAVILTAWLSFTENCEFICYCLVIYFPVVEHFLFYWQHLHLNPHPVIKKTTTLFQAVCSWEFHPILQVIVYFTQKVKLYLFAEEKMYSAIWRGSSKKYKYYHPTRQLQNEFSSTSSACVFEYIVLTEGGIFQMIFPSHRSNSKPASVQPGHFHVGSRKQVRLWTIDLNFSAVPHWHFWISENLYNN